MENVIKRKSGSALKLFLQMAVAGTLGLAACSESDNQEVSVGHDVDALGDADDGGIGDGGTGDAWDYVAWQIDYKRYVIGESVVGSATSPIKSTPGDLAQYQLFENGVIVYTVDIGAAYMSHQIFNHWLSLQGQMTADGQDLYVYLKGPTTDMAAKDGYMEVTFYGGRVIVDSSDTPYTVYGDIERRYGSNWERLGAPVSDEIPFGTGRYQEFQNGNIYTKSSPNAYIVLKGTIFDKWESDGGPGGALGYPVVDAMATTGIQSGRFENGVIYASDTTLAVAIRPPKIITAYENDGGPRGWLGLPIKAGVALKCARCLGDDYVDFQNGVIVNHKTYGDPSDPTKVTAEKAYKFGELKFHLQKIAGFNDWWGSSDTYAWGTLTTSSGPVFTNKRFPDSGTSAEIIVNKDFPDEPFTANSDFTMDVSLNAFNENFWTDDDWLGTATETYDIFNLWGAEIPSLHIGRDENEDDRVEAAFNVKNSYPCSGEDFRQCYWWSMENDGTDKLDWTTYAESFTDVDPDENHYIHPLNWLYYTLAYKGVADGGNCYGMSMESIYAQLGRSPYGEPIYQYTGDQSQNPSLWHDFNVQQGRQLGINQVLYFIAAFASGMTHDPAANFDLGYALEIAGRHSIVSITYDELFGKAHTMRPITYADEKIMVADPNKPYPADPPYPDANYITITRIPGVLSSYEYDEYVGNTFAGGRMFVVPFDIIESEQTTPLAILTPWELIDGGMLAIFGSTARVQQIADDEGRTFFKPDLKGLPTKWEDIQDTDSRLPNLAPIPIAGDEPMNGQLYGGLAMTGATNSYNVVGTEAGASYEAGFSTALLGSHFEVPGTPDKADIITLRDINADEKAIAFKIPEDGIEKNIAWTVSGINKNLWTRLGDLRVEPDQEIAIHVENGGAKIIIDNQGGPTSTVVTVTDAVKGTSVDGGPVDIPTGVTIIGVLSPVVVCKDVTVEATSVSCSVDVSVDNGSFDPNGAALTSAQSPAGPYGAGEHSVTLTATNTIGLANSCTANVTIVDSILPEFTSVPPDVVSDPCTGAIGSIGFAEAVDNCGGDVAIENDAPATFPEGVTTVTWTATDNMGNSTTYRQTVTVVTDTTPPQFTSVPADVVATPCTGAPDIGSVVAADNCGAVIVENNAPATFPKGTTIVTWTATDTAGNATVHQQTVRVDDAIDLGAEHRVSSVLNNACLKISRYPSWSKYMHSIIIQPQAQGVGFPIPFTWKNCNTGATGSLPGPWQQDSLRPVDASCPTLIQLRGNGSGAVSLTWWGNG